MYLYIFENGEMAQSKLSPTDADDTCIDDGILQVITIDSDRSFVDCTGLSAKIIPQAMRLLDTANDGYEFTSAPITEGAMEACGFDYA
jgi:hypothetical protein